MTPNRLSEWSEFHVSSFYYSNDTAVAFDCCNQRKYAKLELSLTAGAWGFVFLRDGVLLAFSVICRDQLHGDNHLHKLLKFAVPALVLFG